MVKLDNTIHETVENTSPQELSNVNVYLSNSGDDPLNGVVKNLVYSSEDTTGCSYLGKIRGVSWKIIKYFVPTDQSLYESAKSSRIRKDQGGTHGARKVFDDEVDNSKEKPDYRRREYI